MSGLCSRMAGPLRAHSRSRRQMIELSATWVNRLALTSMPLLAATPAEAHSAARLAGPPGAHARSRRQMMGLSARGVTRRALPSMPLRAAPPAETHSAARLEAVYTSGDQDRSEERRPAVL